MAMPRWGLAALLLAGCASAPPPHPSTDHPADAAAPEAPVTRAADALDAFVLPRGPAQAAGTPPTPTPTTATEDPHAGHR